MSNSNNFQIENTHPKDMQNDYVIGIVFIYILYNAFKLYFCGYFIVGIMYWYRGSDIFMYTDIYWYSVINMNIYIYIYVHTHIYAPW
jgi:hypothetical protein